MGTERWWVIRESEILRALRAAGRGDDPDLVMIGLLANSRIEKRPPDAE